MPTPDRLLAAVCSLIAAFCFGAYLGYQYCDGHHAKSAAAAQEQFAEDVSKGAETGKRQAVGRVRRDAVASERAEAARSRGVNDAILKAGPVCSRDDGSLRLLNDAIDAANGTPGTAGSLPETMPAAQQTERR